MRPDGTSGIPVVLVLVLTLVFSSSAQRASKSDLVLSATLTRTPNFSDRYQPAFGFNEPGFAFEIYFQFRNNSETALIVLQPGDQTFYGSRKITFSENVPCLKEKVATIAWTSRNEFVSSEQQIKWHADEFRRREPNERTFRIIPPGGYFEGYDRFRIPAATPKDKSPCQFPSFTVEYYLSARDIGEDTDFLRGAELRWKPLGQLFLDGNDTYSVVSTEIAAPAKP